MPEYMKTLITDGKGNVEIAKCPLPEMGDCDALVKTISCGVCNGTDAKLIHGAFKGFGEKDYPVMLGHEGVGRVIKTGREVVSYKEGDIVLLPFAGPLGGYGCGWGAFSEFATVIDAQALMNKGILRDAKEFPESACAQTIVPKWVDPVKAAMIITLREVLSAIRYFGIKKGCSVVVFGCGPVGLTFIKFMSLLGVKTIVALDIVEEKLHTAKQEGAHYVLDSREGNWEEKIREMFPEGVDFILDAVGMPEVINGGMRLIKDRGKICCYGISADTKAEIDWSDAPYNWQLVFQQFPSKYEEGEANDQVLTWLKERKISLDDFISDIISFDNILDAFHRLEKKQISKKCIITYE